MTATNAWLSEDSATVYTDGAWILPDGSLHFVAPKVLIMPHLNACMVLRGASHIAYAFNHVIPALCETFDDLAEAMPWVVLNPPPDLQPVLGPESVGQWQTMLVGYSERDQAFRGYLFQTVRGNRGPEAKTETFSRILTPSDAPLIDECTPIEHDPGPERAADIMERQRRITGPRANGGQGIVVGGFGQRTHLTPHGITSSIIRRWPDELGKPIIQHAA